MIQENALGCRCAGDVLKRNVVAMEEGATSESRKRKHVGAIADERNERQQRALTSSAAAPNYHHVHPEANAPERTVRSCKKYTTHGTTS